MNITIGQYLKGDSWIYKVDPRIKIISLILLIATTFIIPSLLQVSIALGLVFVLIISTKISLIKMLNGLRPLVFLLLFTFVIQVSYLQEGRLLFSETMHITLYSLALMILTVVVWRIIRKRLKYRLILFLSTFIMMFVIQYFISAGPQITTYQLTIYQAGVERAGFLFFRIIIVVMLSSLLTFTTMPTDLNNGLESVMKPFKYIGVSVSEIAMMLSITLRFIPTLLEETNKIMKAQASRGVDFSENKLKDKVMQIISLLIPMFVVSFKRAEDLANAMEARGYIIGAPRTKIDEMKIRYGDILALILTLCLLSLVIFMRIYAR